MDWENERGMSMNSKTKSKFHWLTGIAIGILVLVLALFMLKVLEIDVLYLFTPLIVVMIAGGVFLALVIYYLGRWVRIQEIQGTGNSTEQEKIRTEILQLRQSVDAMQKKLDTIERILVKVAE
jgi:type VI protein secretion system component VasK